MRTRSISTAIVVFSLATVLGCQQQPRAPVRATRGTYRWSASYLMAHGRYADAIATCDIGLKKFPSAGELYWIRGEALHAQGDFSSAMNSLSEALRLARNGAPVLASRGVTRFALGDHDGAKVDFERAIALNDLPVAHGNLSRFLSACPDASLRDGAAALDHARFAFDKVPDFWGYAEAVAMAYAELGDFATASEYQQKAIDMLSANLTSWLRSQESLPDEATSVANDAALATVQAELADMELRLKQFQEGRPFRGVTSCGFLSDNC